MTKILKYTKINTLKYSFILSNTKNNANGNFIEKIKHSDNCSSATPYDKKAKLALRHITNYSRL